MPCNLFYYKQIITNYDIFLNNTHANYTLYKHLYFLAQTHNFIYNKSLRGDKDVNEYSSRMSKESRH